MAARLRPSELVETAQARGRGYAYNRRAGTAEGNAFSLADAGENLHRRDVGRHHPVDCRHVQGPKRQASRYERGFGMA
jgi:hypothetical protein